MAWLKAIRENPLKAANTHPRANTAYAIWSPQDGTAFAVAESGTVFRWSPAGVETAQVDGQVDFYDVFGFSAADVWAVGTFGAVWRYDGSRWSEFARPTAEWLEAVWGRSPQDMFAAGDEGTVLHYDGVDWTVLRTGMKNRLYSISGLDDGTTYVTGSFGTVLQVQGSTVRQITTGTDAHLLGITRIPGTNRLLACGTKGALLSIEDGRVTHLPTGTLESLYGLEAASEREIVVVGWRGTALSFDGQRWQKHPLGANSFMEGVARVAEGRYVAAGWFGRIMSFEVGSGAWATHQTGRGERITAVAATRSRALALADTGTVLHGASGADLRVSFVRPVDLQVAASVAEDRFVVAGDEGFLAFVRVDATGALAVEPADLQDPWDVRCGSRFAGGVYLSGQSGRLLRVRDGDPGIEEVEAFRRLTRGVAMRSIAHLSDQVFFVQRLDGSVHRLDLAAGTMTEVEAKGEALLFGDHGRAYLAKSAVLHRLALQGPAGPGTDLSPFFATAGERASCGVVLASGEVLVGGTRGSVVLLGDGKTPQGFQSGAYARVTAVDGDGASLYVGLTGARIQVVDLSARIRASLSVSAPTYNAACGAGAGVVVGGEAGSFAYLADGAQRVDLASAGRPRDLLAGLALDAGVVCLAGAGVLMTVQAGALLHELDLDGQVVTALCLSGDRLLLGTSRGEILALPWARLLDRTAGPEAVTRVSTGLGAPIVGLAVSNGRLRALLADGRVLLAGDPPELIYHFRLQELTRPAVPEYTDAFCVGGNDNFLCRVDGRVLEIFTLPEVIYTVSLHGRVGPGDYWAGGSSGTLLLLSDGDWYKVHTGIGNRLAGVAHHNRRVVVCGTYGAIRFDDSDFIGEAIGRGVPPPVLEAVARRELVAARELPEGLPCPHVDRSTYGV